VGLGECSRDCATSRLLHPANASTMVPPAERAI
jgi:hypothetical protein